MNTKLRSIVAAMAAVGMMSGLVCAEEKAAPAASGVAAAEKEASGHSKDYRTFKGAGPEYGKIGDSYTAELVMYLAGNQFMVIDDLIQDFQKKNPDIKSIYVETIPPGDILNQQLLKQGEVDGQKTAQNPDLYASVSLAHLKKAKEAGLMDQYMVYIHNKLELMVAKGNPKKIKGPQDLGRDDLVQSHPNPVNEGIFQVYGTEMLKDLNLYDKVTADKKCAGCWAVQDKVWFTERHHRETPLRIENGQADVGIVWSSEVKEAQDEGRKVEGVAIPEPFNKADKVAYVIGALKAGRNQANAEKFVKYLATPAAQAIYSKFGFGEAKAAEMVVKPIP